MWTFDSDAFCWERSATEVKFSTCASSLDGCACLNRISASISGASAGLGRRAERQRVEVGLIGRASVKARMRPMAVVEVDVAAERSSRLVDAVIGPQIHLLVFDTAPEALEEHVIAPRAPAVHA